MTEITQEEEDLLEKALAEEKTYNWLVAAKIYERVVDSFSKKKLLEKTAEIYRKLGYSYSRAAFTVKTAEKLTEYIQQTIKAYTDAMILFEQIGNKSMKLECEAEASYFSGHIASSTKEARETISNSYELFFEVSEEYSREVDQEHIARILGRIVYVSIAMGFFMTDPKEIEEFYIKHKEIAHEAQNLSKKVENVRCLAESLYAEYYLTIGQNYIKPFRWNERLREYYKNFLLRYDESLDFVEKHDDLKAFTLICLTFGNLNGFFAINFVEDENEQRKYLDNALRLLEKSSDLATKLNDISLINESIYWLVMWAILGGRVKYYQRRFSIDLKRFIEIAKILKDTYTVWRSQANILLGAYYANNAQRSYFTSDQRKSYAERAIEYAKSNLTEMPFSPFTSDSYVALTYSYSQLSILASSKDKQEKNAQKMLQYAKQAGKIAEKYEGGWVRAYGYNSLYRAYKTLADIAQDEETKIEMLSAAIDASENYVEHSNESRTGIITAQIRLGLLYEDFGILTKNNDILVKAKELFLQVAKESEKRGYQSYTAAAFEYLARIGDRLGNHTASANYYEMAQNAHTESLKNVEYKPLIKRINEKLNYVKAWNLIEIAKVNHKSENHQEAKENYNNACEILKNLPSFNYEANYYSAWAAQEIAEQLSKQEKHREAIEQYIITIDMFENAIKTLEQRLDQSKEKMEIERIEKLIKVAKLRASYCSARIDVEKARIIGKQGEHITAAELFASAASQFRYVCNLFKTEKERVELEAVYYLCRAWESMELAEKYEDHDRFSESANLFIKASNLFTDSKLKLLASGNSSFCQALKLGCEFDKTQESKTKAQLYPKIKSMLRTAASSYEKGGFKNGGDWALATSTYFDAVWHLIRADEELEISNKKNLLDIGANYLKSAAELFSKAGYKDKEREILVRLERLEQEEKILVSALNTIKKPAISSSTTGIIAPACSLETSQSPRLGEVYQFTEEERRVIGERITKKKYQIIYRDLFKEYPRAQKREFRVGIAQIGISETGDILSDFYEMMTSGLLSLREDKVENVRTKVKNMVERAHKDGVNVLLFPEMTIDLNYGELLEDISDLAKLYEMYIIPGSFHDQETKRNIAMVFGPDGILWEQEKHIPAIIRHGKTEFKEGIEVGELPRKVFVCNTEFGRIAIAICRDFLDMDLRVELKNFEPPVDIVINPAFTPVTADFKAAHFDARRSIYAYCFFANVAEFGDSLIYTPEKDRTERNIPAKEEGLIYKDIDLFKLRSERKKWEKEQKKELQFIQSTR
ncbi:MAG: carbon-nitrogen hydrolase family protein [Candidatus Lokiarchaeota archaeon]|nr:carbon-nitrogen hydrolase family protein [Candidatus Lokiarchaeota archaeon]